MVVGCGPISAVGGGGLGLAWTQLSDLQTLGWTCSA